MKKIMAVAVLSLLLSPFISSAAGLTEAKDVLNNTVKENTIYNTENTWEASIGNILNIAFSLLGIIFVIITIYAGFLWMNANGNEQQTEKAQTMIRQALIGLVVVLAAYAITYFVFNILLTKK